MAKVREARKLLWDSSLSRRNDEGVSVSQCVDDGVAAGGNEDKNLREHVGDDQHVQLIGGWSDAGTLLVVGGHVTLLGNGDPLQHVVRRLTYNFCYDDNQQPCLGSTVASYPQ